MTNEQKYKTQEERKTAFDCFCHNRICEFCPCNGDVIKKTASERNTVCKPKWLALEAEEEKPKTEPTIVVETVLRFNGEQIASSKRLVKSRRN